MRGTRTEWPGWCRSTCDRTTSLAGLLLLAAVASTGCAGGLWSSAPRPDLGYRVLSKVTAPVIPPPGLLYGSVHASLGPDLGPVGSRKGTATSHQVGRLPLPFTGLASGLDLFAWGDASLDAARVAGGITRVGNVDYRMQSFVVA